MPQDSELSNTNGNSGGLETNPVAGVRRWREGSNEGKRQHWLTGNMGWVNKIGMCIHNPELMFIAIVSTKSWTGKSTLAKDLFSVLWGFVDGTLVTNDPSCRDNHYRVVGRDEGLSEVVEGKPVVVFDGCSGSLAWHSTVEAIRRADTVVVLPGGSREVTERDVKFVRKTLETEEANSYRKNTRPEVLVPQSYLEHVVYKGNYIADDVHPAAEKWIEKSLYQS